jgi:hypothetical protein
MKSDIDPQSGDQSVNQQGTTDPESVDNGKESRPMDSNESVARTQVPGTERATMDPNERQNASQSVPAAQPKESKFDYYVHLANGEIRKVTAKALGKSRDESGTQHAFNENGVQHTVIGVYPKEVQLPDVKDDEDE